MNFDSSHVVAISDGKCRLLERDIFLIEKKSFYLERKCLPLVKENISFVSEKNGNQITSTENTHYI